MKNIKNDDNFFSKLLQETMDFKPVLEGQREFILNSFEGEHTSEELTVEDRYYNVSSKIKLLNINQIEFSVGEYLNQIKCYRFCIFDNIIDFPQNWAFIHQLHCSLTDDQEFFSLSFHINNDPENLFRIFQVSREYIRITIFIENSSIIFVLLKKGQEKILDQILGVN